MNDFHKSYAVSRGIRAAITWAGVVALTNATAMLGQTVAAVPTVSASAAVATNPTPCSCMSDVIVRVNNLSIKLNQRKTLLSTLMRAGNRISKCQVVGAGRIMVQFATQTQKLVRAGALDQVTATSLADCASTIRLCGLDCTASSSNQPPVALAKPLVLAADANCQADPPATQFDNGSFDPNGIILSRSVTPPGPYPVGETLVTYTVVDNHGASNSVSTSVRVEDTSLSVSNFTSNFLVFVAPGQSGGPANFPEPAISDQCAGVAAVSFVPPSGTFFPLGVTTAALIVVDGLGTTNQLPFNVVVLPDSGGNGGSNLPPVAIAQAVTNAADANCQAGVTADQVDNHSFSPNGSLVSRSVAPAGPFPVGSTTPVTLTVVDNHGVANSATTTVTVLDLTPPTILTPPADIAATPALGQPSVVVNFPTLSVTDTCSTVVGMSYTPPSGTAFGEGTNPVTCEVYDEAGNTNTAHFRVIVTVFDASVCATIPGLIQRVQAIPLTGYFNAGRRNTMVKKLEQAQVNLGLTRMQSAKYLLEGFITSCSVYQKLNLLDSVTAKELIFCATHLQANLKAGP